jgi:hypothetical protein
MDFAILGLTAFSGSATGAILAAVSFWLNRGKVEGGARAHERGAMTAATGTWLGSPTIGGRLRLTSRLLRRWPRLTPLRWLQQRIDGQPPLNAHFGELNQRIDRLLDGWEA